MILFTAHYGIRDPDRLDITRGGCDRARADGKPTPGAIFAPSPELFRDGKRWRAAARGNSTAEQEGWVRYASLYRLEQLAAWRAHREEWEAPLRRERVVIVCFCSGEDAAARRCHRFLLAGFWTSPKLGVLAADYRGELR